MKKSTHKITGAILIYIMLTTANAMAQFPFNDGFESGNFTAGGWSVSGGAIVSTASPSQGLYCAEGVASWGLIKTIPSITDTLVFVEFDVKASQTNTTCLIFRIRDVGGVTSAGFILNNLGQALGVNGASAGVPLLNYSAGQWYKVRMELNMNSQTYDIYIDNMLLANDFNFFSSGFYMPQDFSWSSIAATGSAWLDGVSIYSGTITGVNESLQGNKNVLVFPNPAAEKLSVKIAHNGPCNAAIYNTHGEKILFKKISEADNTIELSDLARGMYLLNMSDETGFMLHSKKFMKQ